MDADSTKLPVAQPYPNPNNRAGTLFVIKSISPELNALYFKCSIQIRIASIGNGVENCPQSLVTKQFCGPTARMISATSFTDVARAGSTGSHTPFGSELKPNSSAAPYLSTMSRNSFSGNFMT